MKDIRDKVAAITGAGSGIGRCLSMRFAEEGSRIAISDVNEEGLAETAEFLKARGTDFNTYRVDVSDRERVRRWAAEVERDFGGVDVIVNNAGVVVADNIEDISYEDFEWVMNINFWGVVYGTKEFLPYLRKRPWGHIVNISSLYGMMPFPYNGPYNCSKFAVRAFNETLVQELGTGPVRVTSVHPGGIKTNLVRSMRFRKHFEENASRESLTEAFDRTAMNTPDKCAAIIVRAVKKNRERLMVGMDAVLLDLVARAIPLTNLKLTHRLAGWMLVKK